MLSVEISVAAAEVAQLVLLLDRCLLLASDLKAQTVMVVKA